MSFDAIQRVEVNEAEEEAPMDIPALEYGTKEMARQGEEVEILLTHPEETLIRGWAEEGTPRRFAPGGTVYHGDTECLHLAYPRNQGLSDFDREVKEKVKELYSEMVKEDLYWHGRDLLVDRNCDPARDPQLAGLAIINGKNYSIARTCSKASPPEASVEKLIEEDGLTDPETYRNLNYFMDQEGITLDQHLEPVDEKVQTVEEYLAERNIDKESYEAARKLQKRDSGIEPRSCVTDFRPTS